MKHDLLEELDAFFTQLQDMLLDTSKETQDAEDADAEGAEKPKGFKKLIQFGIIGKILIMSIIFIKKIVIKYVAFMVEKTKFEAKLWRKMIVYFSILLVFFASAWLFFFLYIAAVFYDAGFRVSNSILMSFGIQFFIALIMFVLIKVTFSNSVLARKSELE